MIHCKDLIWTTSKKFPFDEQHFYAEPNQCVKVIPDVMSGTTIKLQDQQDRFYRVNLTPTRK